MNNVVTVNYENKPAYDIILAPDFNKLAEAIEALGMSGRRFMIVSDTNAGRYFMKDVYLQLAPLAKSVHSYTFPSGEVSKNLSTASYCYEQLIEAGFDRNDVLIALGGGVVGDLTGYVAATYLRGVRFIQIPTTLLSMVDSSIGGKTGVDFKAYKNMVGAFHQPKLVYTNLTTLSNLPDKEYFSGFGEIIKHGLIKDASYYTWLKEKHEGICNKNYEALQEMIFRSSSIKKDVVERDPKEQGERALLNFGHTIGHSVEKLKDLTLLHGECVCIGMAAAAYISMKRSYISSEAYVDIIETIKLFHEPVTVEGLSAEDIYEATKRDKKMDADKIKFILLENIGKAVIDTSVTRDELLSAIGTIIN